MCIMFLNKKRVFFDFPHNLSYLDLYLDMNRDLDSKGPIPKMIQIQNPAGNTTHYCYG